MSKNPYINKWIWQDKVFETEDLEEMHKKEPVVGFVYLITNNATGKMYVGKKGFWQHRKLPPLKGKKRKRLVVKESDWKEYYGSSSDLQREVEEQRHQGKLDGFYTRQILHLCNSKGLLSYMELKEQVQRDVLFKEEYLNAFIGCKIHASHINSQKKGVQCVPDL